MLIYTTGLIVTVFLFGRGDILSRHDVEEFQNPDVGLPLDKLVTQYGYLFEYHQVITQDGYILGVQRINNSGPVVFLQGGLWCDASSWILTGPKKALALLLADAGYDVWLGNTRGTTLSRAHTILKPDRDNEYWDFSFHEMGVYDLPAMIDYILNVTGVEKLSYIGHSQGASTFLIMIADRPEYNSKVNFGTLFAPATTMHHSRNPFMRFFAWNAGIFEWVVHTFQLYEFFPYSDLLHQFSMRFCHPHSPALPICRKVFELFAGSNPEQFNYLLIPTITTYIPCGSASKQILHFFQLRNSGRFQKYDYGPERNLKLYNCTLPPEYDISKINVPILLYGGTGDWMIDFKDVEELATNIPNLIELHTIEHYNHLDYKWAINVKSTIYIRLLQLLGKYNGIDEEITLKVLT